MIDFVPAHFLCLIGHSINYNDDIRSIVLAFISISNVLKPEGHRSVPQPI